MEISNNHNYRDKIDLNVVSGCLDNRNKGIIRQKCIYLQNGRIEIIFMFI